MHSLFIQHVKVREVICLPIFSYRELGVETQELPAASSLKY